MQVESQEEGITVRASSSTELAAKQKVMTFAGLSGDRTACCSSTKPLFGDAAPTDAALSVDKAGAHC